MSVNFIKGAALALCGALTLSAGPALAQEAKSLDELLKFVKQGQAQEAKENRQREQRFSNDKANQAASLKRAEDERARQEALSTELENAFEANELEIADKQELLREKLGTLTELFGHLTSASGDLASNVEVSLISAQYPGREAFLRDLVRKMSNSDDLPSIEEIERVWFELLQEIRETGEVTAFSAEVSSPGGERASRDVVRVGSFNIIDTDGNYLSYDNDTLSELARQPSGPYTGWAKELAAATSGLHTFGIDPTGPTGGSFLAAIIDTPTLNERWHQGGYVGYAITAVGIFALFLAVYRMVALASIGGKVNAQLKSDKANDNNPLGRCAEDSRGQPQHGYRDARVEVVRGRAEGNTQTGKRPQHTEDHRGGSAADGSSGYRDRHDFDLPGNYDLWRGRSQGYGGRYFQCLDHNRARPAGRNPDRTASHHCKWPRATHHSHTGRADHRYGCRTHRSQPEVLRWKTSKLSWTKAVWSCG